MSYPHQFKAFDGQISTETNRVRIIETPSIAMYESPMPSTGYTTAHLPSMHHNLHGYYTAFHVEQDQSFNDQQVFFKHQAPTLPPLAHPFLDSSALQADIVVNSSGASVAAGACNIEHSDNTNNNNNSSSNNVCVCLDTFICNLRKLLETTNHLLEFLSRVPRGSRGNLVHHCRQASLSLNSNDICFESPDLSLDIPKGLGSFGQSYVYAIFSLTSYRDIVSPTNLHHPICGHLKTDMHVVFGAWYYMRRLRANFMTSLRQKMRSNKTDFHFIGCCESTDKNVSVLMGITKVLKLEYPSFCFNIQGHVMSMSLLGNLPGIGHDGSMVGRFEQFKTPSDAHVFSCMRRVVRGEDSVVKTVPPPINETQIAQFTHIVPVKPLI